MKTNILAIAAGLSDQDLLARLHVLAGTEREASVELVAHLAALDTRPAVYAAQAYGSLQPDVPSSVRKLPTFTGIAPSSAAPAPVATTVPEPTRATARLPAAFVPTPRPIVRATAPERSRVQFTIGPETHERLRRIQALLRREIPDGDPGKVFDRALSLLLEKVEKTKLGAAAKPRPCPPIRPRTDNTVPKPALRSRSVPRAVKYEAELIFGPHRQGANRRGGDG
jgi:hypothetical protein